MRAAIEGAAPAMREAMEATYFDAMVRLTPRYALQGAATVTGWERGGESIPCAFSRSGRRGRLGRERSGWEGGGNLLDYDALIFCAPEAEIAPGDRVALARPGGEELILETVGRPVVYPTHQEIGVRELNIL